MALWRRFNVASREICSICSHVNRIGFHVPDEVWRAVVPGDWQDHVLCLECFARLADEKLVAWDRSIDFFPVSMATHLRVSSGDGSAARQCG
jgi:hypothetical protein